MRTTDSVKTDTIVAIATAAGRGGVGVVRVSGTAARAIADGLCGGVPVPREARLVTFRAGTGAALDHGLALFFAAPRSFTGEDVLELHGHGSPVTLARLVRRACDLGARPARAGEFSERAFLNGKLDLTQAEAVADLIAARSEAQAQAALRSLGGEFARRLAPLAATVMRLRVEVEAAIDFGEDATEGASQTVLAGLFDAATVELAEVLAAARRGVRLVDGLHAVIIGAPNVGKSSLMNVLAGDDRAIVTEIPGTTRDVLRESIMLDGIELTLADTAGLREATDAVEGEGIRRARVELERADLVLWVVEHPLDAGQRLAADTTMAPGRILVVNKIDLDGGLARREERDGEVTIHLSARTGAGVDLLREELRLVALGGATDGDFSARARHVDALERAGTHLADARAALVGAAPELVAEDLRGVQRALGEITGEVSSDDLLGAIFSSFCIGK